MKTRINANSVRGITYIGRNRITSHVGEGFYTVKRVGQNVFLCGVNIKWIVTAQELRSAGIKV